MTSTINDQTITVFELTGADVLTFLNNQVFSELKPSIKSSQFTAICNPKGRIIYTLILCQLAEITYVAVDTSLSDNFLQYINMRRFRMDVNINKSTSLLSINTQNEQPNLKVDTAFVDNSDLIKADNDTFWLFMFKTGLPWITIGTTERYIPQHLNLDQSSVIDFDKGCYPGQEIIARLHFLGKIKKRMQYIQYESEQAYPLNSKVETPEYSEVIETCAPAIFHQKKWHSQAIITI